MIPPRRGRPPKASVQPQPTDDPSNIWAGVLPSKPPQPEQKKSRAATPAIPQMPKVEPPTPPPASAVALGPPPDDPMAGAKWAYQMHLKLAHEAFVNPNLNSKERESRVLKLLSGAAKHMTDAQRYDVAQIIESERRQLEAKKRGKAAARMESAPSAPDEAKVIPIRSADGES